MEPISADVRLSFERSRTRRRVLIMLSSLGEAYPRQLALMARVPPQRIWGILEGGTAEYAEDLSLVSLGLARVVRTPRGRKTVVTERGRRYARRYTARWRQGSRKRGALDR